MKRDATPEELEDTLATYERMYPSTRQKHAEAVQQGYKAETCHITKCPFRDDANGSLLDQLQKSVNETVAEPG